MSHYSDAWEWDEEDIKFLPYQLNIMISHGHGYMDDVALFILKAMRYDNGVL